MNRSRILVGILLLSIVLGLGCASGPSSFVRDDVDYSYVQRVAVFPFNNYSQDIHAGSRVYQVFMTDLLERQAFEVLGLSDVLAGMAKLKMSTTATPTADQVTTLGQELGVDALFFGTVDEYGLDRVSNQRIYIITGTFNLLETETGSLIWKAQIHHDGTSLMRKLFGGGSASQHDVAKTAVHRALDSLF